jgi:multidrug efflux pump
MLFVPTFFVVVLTLFKTKPKLSGAHAPLTTVHHGAPADQAGHSPKDGGQA